MCFNRLKNWWGSRNMPVRGKDVISSGASRAFSFFKESDKPISYHSDKLGRSNLARTIAERLKQDAEATDETGKQDLSHTVLGIEGDWGSGKSFTVQLIRNELEKNKEFLWLEFRSWMFRDHEDLTNIFLSWLAENLGRQQGFLTRLASSLIKKFYWLLKLASFSLFIYLILVLVALLSYFLLQGFSTVLGVGSSLIFLAVFWVFMKSLKDSIPFQMNRYIESLNTERLFDQKARIKKMLLDSRQLPSRIFICIEDIDRLSPNEVQTVFQTIRMIADFPRVTYIIPFDKKHVIRSLGYLNGAVLDKEYGEGTIQKVMHSTVKLPRVNRSKCANLLLDKFKSYSKQYYSETVA